MKVELQKRAIFWYIRLIAKNGEVLMHSETYYNKSNAIRALNKLQKEIK